VIQSRKIRWAPPVGHTRHKINASKILIIIPEWKRPLGEFSYKCEEARILLKLIFVNVKAYTRFICLKTGSVGWML
jgi:hypothetical protein